jgi:hypothetical protein
VSRDWMDDLDRVLETVDRPGSFCVSGSAPAVLPGLEVKGLGPIGLPLTASQAKELRGLCEQAPYGKGEETVVDTKVRRVWRLKPEQFTLKNPEWEKFLGDAVRKVQEELGLEKQKLTSHLYELLLYEKGSFFLPHRDGEKLDRMVGTLTVVLPSSFQGGELVVRHEGQERTIDFGGGDDPFHIHYAAFYADCEHEIRPLRGGYRLCLVYNLTLAKGKKSISAPRSSEPIERATKALRAWAEEGEPAKLAITLEHRYTQEGLSWDALKGVDRAQAHVLVEAARAAGCHAYLALLTLHESGSAEYTDGYGGGYGRGRWYDYDEEEEEGEEYEMGEIYETTLDAEHLRDPEGNRLAVAALPFEEEELFDPEALQEVEPEEEFEGYTGNAGMTLDRWYRHGAILLWPDRTHFDVLCDAGTGAAVEALKLLMRQWKKARKKEAEALKERCVAFASRIIARWPEQTYGYFYRESKRDDLLPVIAPLEDPGLVRAYLSGVLARDASADPGKALVRVCQKHGWGTFRGELEAVFNQTTEGTLGRNVGLLEHLCLAGAGKKEGWAELCGSLAQGLLTALERIDQAKPEHPYYYHRQTREAAVLAGLARALLAGEQKDLLARLVAHILGRPEQYPLIETHVAALTALGPWLKKHVKKPVPALSQWLAVCVEQLEGRTAEEPQAPADFRREAPVSCKCRECAELKRFMADPLEQTHRFPVREERRQHIRYEAERYHLDLDFRVEERGRPYTLVCTKNMASYREKLKTYRQDLEHLATLRAIQAALAKSKRG